MNYKWLQACNYFYFILFFKLKLVTRDKFLLRNGVNELHRWEYHYYINCLLGRFETDSPNDQLRPLECESFHHCNSRILSKNLLFLNIDTPKKTLILITWNSSLFTNSIFYLWQLISAFNVLMIKKYTLNFRWISLIFLSMPPNRMPKWCCNPAHDKGSQILIITYKLRVHFVYEHLTWIVKFYFGTI